MTTKTALAVTAVVHPSLRAPPKSMGMDHGSRSWTVTLKFEGREMRVPFYTGSALRDPPTAADVLRCIASDASSADDARSFGEWAADYGYSEESRDALRTYRACESLAKQLRALLGDRYEGVVHMDEDELREAVEGSAP